MLKQYTESRKTSAWKKVWVFIFLIPVALIVYMFHLESREMHRTIEKIEQERLEFLQRFDIVVSRSGYLKKKHGLQEIYVPSVVILVTNCSEQECYKIHFVASFLKDDKIFCRGAVSLKLLHPWETKEIFLRCIDSAVFGSVVSGLNLMETTSEISYTISVNQGNKHATALEGIIQFNTFAP